MDLKNSNYKKEVFYMKQNNPNSDLFQNRIIAEPSKSPSIEIKTNLDSKNLMENNPYYDEKNMKNEKEREKFEDFFDREN